MLAQPAVICDTQDEIREYARLAALVGDVKARELVNAENKNPAHPEGLACATGYVRYTIINRGPLVGELQVAEVAIDGWMFEGELTPIIPPYRQFTLVKPEASS